MRMRTLRLLPIMLVMGINMAVGQAVDRETARDVAETFFKKNVMKDRSNQNIHFDDITAETEFQNFYIFSADSGFVLVAADERVIPILGYSKTGPFVTEDMPENLRSWLEGYEEQIQIVKENNIPDNATIKTKWNSLKKGEEQPTRGDRSTVLYLFTTKWDQGFPYNDKCPEDPDIHPNQSGHQKCVTGCTATAVAQIMKYWRHPVQGIGNIRLTKEMIGNPKHPEIYPLEVNFAESTYNWSDTNMPDQITSSSDQNQIDEISKLMSDVGIAMHMDYCSKESDAWLIRESMTGYFDYSSALHKESMFFYENEVWLNMLKNEINAHRPVYYVGIGTGGHAFVLIGYDEDDKFLVNWGWSGWQDDYWAIGQLNPQPGGTGGGSYEFNEGNAAFFHLLPNNRTLLPPINLNVHNSINSNELILEWSLAEHAESYVILRNGRFLAETSSTSYTDDGIYGGSFTYQVITIGENHRASLPSESVTYTKAYETPKPTSMSAVVTDCSVVLNWEDVSNPTVPFFHHKQPFNGEDIKDIPASGYNNDTVSIYEVFKPYELNPYSNRYISRIYYWVSNSAVGKEHVLNIWGDDKFPFAGLLYHYSFTPSNSGPMWHYLSSPLRIEGDIEDLVVSFTIKGVDRNDVAAYYLESNDELPSSYYDSNKDEQYILRLPLGHHYIIDMYAKWAEELTYNIYRSDGQSIICVARELEEPNYTDANLPYGTYTYYVTTNYYGGESEPSESVTVTIGTAHSVTCASTSHGSISASPSSATPNTTVTVTATPDTGYSLSQLYYMVSGSTECHYIPHSTGQFIMPDGDVMVYAEFASNELTIDNLEELIEFRNIINTVTMGGFIWKGNQVNDFGIGSVFYLTADIDINPGYVFSSNGWYTYTGGGTAPGVEQWSPIGQIVTPPESWNWQGGSVSFIGGFGGTFEGNNHTISGLYINGTDSYRALFSYLLPQGTIRNLTVDNAFVGGQDYSAIICSVSSGNIENCHSYGTVVGYRGAGIAAVSVGTVQGSGKCIINCTNHAEIKADNAGGICLGMVDGLVQGCTNYGSINGNTTADCWTCGGIVGKVVNGRVNDNVNSGTVRGNKAGGIVGELIDSSIRGCTSSSLITVSGGDAKLGGVVGEFSTQSTQTGYYYVFNTCANTGSVQGEGATVGGLVGNVASGNLYIGNSHSSGDLSGAVVGGVLGQATTGLWQVNGCYNTGAVSGTSDIGGILGKMSVAGYIYNSYNQGAISGSNNKGGLVGYVSSGASGFVLDGCSNNGAIGGDEEGNAGGFIGAAAQTGTITSCNNTGAITDAAISGGIIGVISGGVWTMSNRANTLTIQGTTIGGIVGSVTGGNVSFVGCSNQAELNGENVGGILGSRTGGSVSFNNCENDGTLTGTIVGGISASFYGTMENCTNSGPISGATVGGMTAVFYGGTLTNCRNDASLNGYSLAGGVVGLANGSFSMHNCHNTATIHGGYARVDGIADHDSSISDGLVDVTSKGIWSIINKGNNISYRSSEVGGLVGKAMNADATFTGCSNHGVLEGSSNGGILCIYEGDGEVHINDCINYASVNENGAGIVCDFYGTSLSIQDCNNYGDFSGDTGAGIAGAITGSATISGCSNYGTLTSENGAGIVRSFYGVFLSVQDCDNYGDFSGAACAGIVLGVGYEEVSSTINISGCHNEGNGQLSEGIGAGVCGIVLDVSHGTGSSLSISDCTNSSDITIAGSGAGSGNAGGILGIFTGMSITPYFQYSTLSDLSFQMVNCVNTGDIHVGNTSLSGYSSAAAGGLIGTSQSVAGMISGCHNDGDVSAGGYAGGINGSINDGSSIQYCYNIGAITATGEDSFAMGIGSGSSIVGCYNVGEIMSDNVSVGIGISLNLDNCYNVANLTGAFVAGITLYYLNLIQNCCNYGHIKIIPTEAHSDFSFLFPGSKGAAAGISLFALPGGSMKNCCNMGTFDLEELSDVVINPIIMGLITSMEPVDITTDLSGFVGYHNYYDKQMWFGSQADIEGVIEGKLTQEMIGDNLSLLLQDEGRDESPWIYSTGSYPRLDYTTASEVGSIPVFLQNAESSIAMESNFYVGALEGSGWTVENNIISINGTSATIESEGSEILSLSKEGIKKSVYLNTANVFETSGSWHTPGNWSMGHVPIEGQNALIKADAVIDSEVDINNIAISQEGSITIQNGQTLAPTGFVENRAGTGGLVIDEGGQFIHENYTLEATFMKSITGYDNMNSGNWYTISMPFVATDIASTLATGDFDLFGYNENQVNEEWENYKADMFDNLGPGVGFLYANGATSNKAISGWLNQTNVNVALSFSERRDALQGFNLIGNPFAHNIYKGAGGAIDDANLASGYYTLTNEGTWHVHTYEDAILPGQGILVKATTATNLTIAKSNMAASSESSASNRALTITVSGETGTDRALAYFSQGIGLNKMENLFCSTASISILSEDGEYAIAHIENDCESIDLHFNDKQDADFTLTIDTGDMKFSYLQLTDRVTGVTMDLLQQPTYTFHATGQEPEARFSITFKVMEE